MSQIIIKNFEKQKHLFTAHTVVAAVNIWMRKVIGLVDSTTN